MNRRNVLGLFGLLPFTSLLKAEDKQEKDLPNVEIGDRIQGINEPQYIGRVYGFADDAWIEGWTDHIKNSDSPISWYNEHGDKWKTHPIYYVKLDAVTTSRTGMRREHIALTQLNCRIIEKGNKNNIIL